MKKRYEEIMDKVEVNEEMYERILGNIQNTDFQTVKKKPAFSTAYRNPILAIAACFAFLLLSTFVLPNIIRTTPPQYSDLQIDGGIIELPSASKLSYTIGFEVSDLTNLPFEVTSTTYSSYFGEIAQIDYSGTNENAVFRKSLDTDDISGDYYAYESVLEITSGSNTITLKGTSESYTLAIWTNEEFFYSLKLSSGLSKSEWITLISGIQ